MPNWDSSLRTLSSGPGCEDQHWQPPCGRLRSCTWGLPSGKTKGWSTSRRRLWQRWRDIGVPVCKGGLARFN